MTEPTIEASVRICTTEFFSGNGKSSRGESIYPTAYAAKIGPAPSITFFTVYLIFMTHKAAVHMIVYQIPRHLARFSTSQIRGSETEHIRSDLASPMNMRGVGERSWAAQASPWGRDPELSRSRN
ncbi:hypothetical protein VTN00DRAFT_375 [Thermoascus crustaceus]|uniref:uncharacterized protein n=1 Tax=Thermoascus crustaceus TaxID=5088 RepID=UPI0037427869